ncbi:MAG: hypothetical protein HQL50_08465 [Magnetococcales bacterium]|nr:hypothetical protein [Magnetococcales bacterium]
MQHEEQVFMESGLWLKHEVENRIGRPLEEIKPQDVDDYNPTFDQAFLAKVRKKLIDVGRNPDEVETMKRLKLIMPLAFKTWFTEC